MVNSAPVPGCPFCGSEALAKDGRRKDGVQKYLCRSCGRRFNPLTGTVFDSHKIPISEWIEYLLHLFEFHSVVTSARGNRNAHTTGVYWLRKVFADPVLANAIIDRLVHHSTIVKITGRSYRIKDKFDKADEPASPREPLGVQDGAPRKRGRPSKIKYE